MKLQLNTPLLLTLFRLLFSPFVLPILLVLFLPLNILWVNCLLAAIFILFNLTDFLDGYLARRYKQETTLGRILDPIADKFLLFATLIALVAVKKIFFYWAIIFIGREFFLMALRLTALEHGFSMPVSWLGKSKTFAQGAYLTIAIMNNSQDNFQLTSFDKLEALLLIIALTISIVSAYDYYRDFIKKFNRGNLLEHH